jgi:hypothetical protein
MNEAKCKAWTYVKPGVQADNAKCWLKDKDSRCFTCQVLVFDAFFIFTASPFLFSYIIRTGETPVLRVDFHFSCFSLNNWQPIPE